MKTRQNYFKFIWHKNEKYGTPIQREHIVYTCGGQADAVNAFISVFGNLKKNTIVKAYDYSNNDTGVEFTPTVLRKGRQYVAI